MINYFGKQVRKAYFMVPKDKREAYEMRINIMMACTECKRRNYSTTKNKKNTPDRIELKKYCKFCKKETMHKETK